MIYINDTISLHENEIHLDFIRASGPGGQNVNKVATAAQLRFDVQRSSSLPEDVRQRLIHLAGKKMTESGTLIITARRYRKQERNRQDAIERLISLIRKATEVPKPRVKTKVSPAAKERRLEDKRQRSQTKQRRSFNPHSEE